MNSYQSIATINAPEFINLQPLDINPMMSKCEIKVLYLGQNRNGTSINKEAASAMAKTLRGAPIVGYYREEKGDFFDHGDQVIYDGEGVHFKTLTKPYGFVAPDAEVWFQEFEEFNEAGESTTRTYMMTTGYLWTGQYKEAQQLFMEGGKPQSMELDENSLQGFWSKEANSECEFFIINDAIFSKLCILGDEVEPCFEGASITAPNISKNFSLDDKFRKTLYQMMKELQYTLQGGSSEVDEIKKKSVDSSEATLEEAVEQVEEQFENTQSAEPSVTETPSTTETTETETQVEDAGSDNQESGTTTETVEDAGNEGADAGVEGGDSGSDGGDAGSSDYAKKDDSEDKEEDKAEDKEEEDDDEDKKKKDEKYALLVTQIEELQQSVASLTERAIAAETELAAYVNKDKDALIAEFSMLSDEDKKDVIEHKAEYSLAEIKSKLAVICFDKKVNYVKSTEEKSEDLTVNIEATKYTNEPEWLQEVDRRLNSK